MSKLPPILSEPDANKPPVLEPKKSGAKFNLNHPLLVIAIIIFGIFAVAGVMEVGKEFGSFFGDDPDDFPPPVEQADSSPPQPRPPNPNEPPPELASRAMSGDADAQRTVCGHGCGIFR